MQDLFQPPPLLVAAHPLAALVEQAALIFKQRAIMLLGALVALLRLLVLLPGAVDERAHFLVAERMVRRQAQRTRIAFPQLLPVFFVIGDRLLLAVNGFLVLPLVARFFQLIAGREQLHDQHAFPGLQLLELGFGGFLPAQPLLVVAPQLIKLVERPEPVALALDGLRQALNDFGMTRSEAFGQRLRESCFPGGLPCFKLGKGML